MNEEFNNQNHDEENIEVEQDNELEHRHTEEPQKQSIIKSIWNHKIMMAIRRFWRKFHVTKLPVRTAASLMVKSFALFPK